MLRLTVNWCLKKIEKLESAIKPLLAPGGQKDLLRLNGEHTARMAAASDIAYQKGFIQGAQFILNILSNNADLLPELPEID